jgi:uncharacterized protein
MPELDAFRPAWWLPGAHAQTIWPGLFRRRTRLRPRRERLWLPDLDFLDLDWGPQGEGPAVMIFHGLEGSSQSNYAIGILEALHAAGFQAVVVHFRGCSGESNKLLRRYHAGATDDMAHVAEVLKGRWPKRPLFAVGYSLGGNALLKWLGETGAANPLAGAVAISVPFQLSLVADRLQTGFSRIYRRYLLRKLIHAAMRKAHCPGFPLLPESFDRLNSMRAYDDLITAPLHGFDSAEDYYAKASCRQYLRGIAVPTLILHALDDPFMSADAVPRQDEVSLAVELGISPKGGHVGFVGGALPWKPDYWLDRKISAWLTRRMERL